MISYLRLRNFKSFSDITLDLRGSKGVPKNVAFLYGENGAGKSNLMYAFSFLRQIFSTMEAQLVRPQWLGPSWDRLEEKVKEELAAALSAALPTLENLIAQCWMIGNEHPMEVELGFVCQGKAGRYFARFTKEGVVEEQLYYTLGERAGKVFSVSAEGAVFSPSTFPNARYRKELRDTVLQFWGKHTFVSILNWELQTKNTAYMQDGVSAPLRNVLHMFESLNVLCNKNASVWERRQALPFAFLSKLGSGEVASKQDKELLAAEKALNSYFTGLYADIKRVYYRFEKQKKTDNYNYALYFDKLCAGQLRSIPLTLESTGTKKLVELFPLLFNCTMGQTACIDEIDTGIHDLLMKDLLDVLCAALEDLPESQLGSQLIATTHNTLLLDALPPESVYVLRSKANGQKEISCITEYEFRTHKNNSVRHRYLQGLYQGVPETGYLDLAELVSDTMRLVQNKAGEEAQEVDG